MEARGIFRGVWHVHFNESFAAGELVERWLVAHGGWFPDPHEMYGETQPVADGPDIMSAHPDRALREAASIMALLDNDDFPEFRLRWGAQNWLEVMRRNSPNDELMPLWNLSPETLLNLQYFVLHKDCTTAGNLQQLTDYLNDPEGERIIRHWRESNHPGPLIRDEDFDRLLGENDVLASQLETMTEGYDRLEAENAELRSQLETMEEHVAAGILNTARPASSNRDGAFTGRSYRLE